MGRACLQPSKLVAEFYLEFGSAQQAFEQIVEQSASLGAHRSEFQAHFFARFDVADHRLRLHNSARNFKNQHQAAPTGRVMSPETDRPPLLSV